MNVYTYKGTWKGRPGVSLSSHQTTGRRAVAHIWDGEDVATVKLIKGDAWKDPDHFVEYAVVVVPKDDAVAAMEKLLNGEHVASKAV